MPDKETLKRAHEDAREGKSPSTQAGEFVKQEMDHIREGKHGARSPQQAIAIGLSEARRAGVKLPPRTRRCQSRRIGRPASAAVQHASRQPRRQPARGRDAPLKGRLLRSWSKRSRSNLMTALYQGMTLVMPPGRPLAPARFGCRG